MVKTKAHLISSIILNAFHSLMAYKTTYYILIITLYTVLGCRVFLSVLINDTRGLALANSNPLVHMHTHKTMTCYN